MRRTNAAEQEIRIWPQVHFVDGPNHLCRGRQRHACGSVQKKLLCWIMLMATQLGRGIRWRWSTSPIQERPGAVYASTGWWINLPKGVNVGYPGSGSSRFRNAVARVGGSDPIILCASMDLNKSRKRDKPVEKRTKGLLLSSSRLLSSVATIVPRVSPSTIGIWWVSSDRWVGISVMLALHCGSWVNTMARNGPLIRLLRDGIGSSAP